MNTADALYKARLLREADEEMDLAWNIHDMEFVHENSAIVLHHKLGKVIHRLKEGDTVVMIKQLPPADKHEG